MIKDAIPDASDTGAPSLFEVLEARWTLRILLLLADRPRRFAELRQSLRGLSANILTARLQKLTVAGLVRRTRLPLPAAVHVYEMTAAAEGLKPTLMELERWRSGAATEGIPVAATLS